MTKKQLIEALAEYPDDASIDVRVRGGAHEIDDDWPVIGVVGSVALHDDVWVTLGLND